MTNKNDLKSHLSDILAELAELEARARDNLANKNFADIVASAKNRVQQLTEHPDLNRVEAGPDYVEEQQLPFDPSAGLTPNTAGTLPPAPGSDFLAQQAPPAAPFPAPSAEPKTYHPGDPKFTQENQNQDFRDPNNVDLNADGTLKTAPNAKGTTDNRDA